MSPEFRRKSEELAVECPLCGERVRPSTKAVEAAVAGDLDHAEAQRLVLVAHLRHEHTEYDEIIDRAADDEFARGTPMETALQIARARARTKTAPRMAWLQRECRKAPGQRAHLAPRGRTLGDTARIVIVRWEGRTLEQGEGL